MQVGDDKSSQHIYIVQKELGRGRSAAYLLQEHSYRLHLTTNWAKPQHIPTPSSKAMKEKGLEIQIGELGQ